MGESSPSVESMGRRMAEVRELSPVQRFAIAPTTRVDERNRLITTVTPV